MMQYTLLINSGEGFNEIYFAFGGPIPLVACATTHSSQLNILKDYSQIFLSWHLGAERQTCHVTLIVPHVMN